MHSHLWPLYSTGQYIQHTASAACSSMRYISIPLLRDHCYSKTLLGSMAEAIAIVGIVASIVQLVDFSSRVLRRLDEFQSNQGELPGSFRHVKAELPVLKYTLQYIRDAIEAGSGEDETKKALIPAIEGCTEQIRLLEPILAKILPTSTDSQLRIHTKAILSFRQESKVDSITKVLQRYIGTLTFYYAAISSTLQPLTGNVTLTEYIESLLKSDSRCKALRNPSMAVPSRSIPQLPESIEATPN